MCKERKKNRHEDIKPSFCFISQERAAQARITDLETQLSRATATATQLKKSKDEVIWQ